MINTSMWEKKNNCLKKPTFITHQRNESIGSGHAQPCEDTSVSCIMTHISENHGLVSRKQRELSFKVVTHKEWGYESSTQSTRIIVAASKQSRFGKSIQFTKPFKTISSGMWRPLQWEETHTKQFGMQC